MQALHLHPTGAMRWRAASVQSPVSHAAVEARAIERVVERVAMTVLVAACGLLPLPAGAGNAADDRLAPPDAAHCPRDQLTLYSGVVVAYRREAGRTTLRIRTEWDTTESVRIRHPGSKDPSRWFLIERAPFTAADWKRIESAPGRLRPAMRAAAWVCSGGGQPVVDWQPPQDR